MVLKSNLLSLSCWYAFKENVQRMIYSPQNGGLFVFYLHRYDEDLFYCSSFITLVLNLAWPKRFSKIMLPSMTHIHPPENPPFWQLKIWIMRRSKISKPRQADARFLCPQLKNLATSGTMLTSLRAKIDFYIDADPDYDALVCKMGAKIETRA